MIPDVLIKTELTARGAKTATAELFSPAATGLTVDGEPAQQDTGPSFAELSQSLMTPLQIGSEVQEGEVPGAADMEGLDPLPAQESIAFDTAESLQAPELKQEFPSLLMSPSTPAQATFGPVAAMPLEAPPSAASIVSPSLAPVGQPLSSSESIVPSDTQTTASAGSANADGAAKTEHRLPPSELPVSAIERDIVKAIARQSEATSPTQLSTVASGKVLPASGDALPQLPELRQWVHKALSDLVPATGSDGLKSAASLTASVTDSVMTDVIEAGLESDAGGAMRQGEGMNRSPETGLAKLATAAPGESDWQQLVERMKVFQQPRLQQVEMIVNQEQLGRMQLQVQVHEGAIRVQFATGQAATQEWLAQQLPGLQAEMEASGLKVDSTRVSEWSSNDSGRRGDGAGQDLESQTGNSDQPVHSDPHESADVRVESGSGMSIFA